MRVVLSLFALFLNACGQLGQIAWQGADQARRYGTRPLAVPDVEAPTGFRVVRVATGFNYPSAMTWDDRGHWYILESHTIPIPMTRTRIVTVDDDGRIRKVPLENFDAPTAIGLTFHEGWLYISHEEKDGSFSISRVRPSGGAVERVLTKLPSEGDHDVNHLVFDKEGTLYFGLGSATNSGVVSAKDGVNQKWLEDHPSTYELPCRDIVLTGRTFSEFNEKRRANVVTGAFQPYGESSAKRVAGKFPCMTAIAALRRGSQQPAFVAWGLRNPVGLALDADGTLFVGMQGADVRSTRPISEDPDAIYRVRQDAWYGWPDFKADFTPNEPFVIDHAASGLSSPDRSLLITPTEPHAAIGGMTFWNGKLLVSEMGDFKPMTDPATVRERAGFQIEVVDVDARTRATFVRNRGPADPEPASTLDFEDALERPVDVKVGPDGMIYILDYGVFVPGDPPKVFPKTGKLFRLEPVR